MESTEKKKVSTKEVLIMLKDGKTRAEIKEEFKLTHAEMKTLFSLPSLKGRRTHTSKSQLEIIDDAGEPDEEENPEQQPDQNSEEETTNEVIIVQVNVPTTPDPRIQPVEEETPAEEVAHQETGEEQAPSSDSSPSEIPLASPVGEVKKEPVIEVEDAWALPTLTATPVAVEEEYVAEEVFEDRAPFDRS